MSIEAWAEIACLGFAMQVESPAKGGGRSPPRARLRRACGDPATSIPANATAKSSKFNALQQNQRHIRRRAQIARIIVLALSQGRTSGRRPRRAAGAVEREAFVGGLE